MLDYKHYSFDLWLTLIKSNPLFKKHRSQYFHTHYNRLSKPIDEVEVIFRQVDVMCNNINEQTGKNIDADEMYLMVISKINEHQIPLHEIDIALLERDMEALLMEFLPVVYCEQTIGVLAQVKEHGAHTNILSNTGFIRGKLLRRVLHMLSIDQYIDFQLYSDEEGFSKPNTAFFDIMLREARTIKPLELCDIVHVGDNIKADIAGATAMGINSMLVNSNNISISKLLHYASDNIFTA